MIESYSNSKFDCPKLQSSQNSFFDRLVPLIDTIRASSAITAHTTWRWSCSVSLGQVLMGCPHLPDPLDKFLRGALAYPMEELTEPASIACHQGQCKSGTSQRLTWGSDHVLRDCSNPSVIRVCKSAKFYGCFGKPAILAFLKENVD